MDGFWQEMELNNILKITLDSIHHMHYTRTKEMGFLPSEIL